MWLCLDNTNRYADVWVNGHKVSGTKDSKRDISGHMLRSRFDITDIVAKKGRNAVAVLIYDADQKKSRHEKGDFANACSPTYLSAAGWDWMPYVPGRMAGITGHVRIEMTGGISMSNTWVCTELPTLSHADLSIQTTLHTETELERFLWVYCCCSVDKLCPILCDPQGLQHARLLCLSLFLRVCSDH